MELDRAELERKVVDICKEAQKRSAEAAQSDLISGHGGPPGWHCGTMKSGAGGHRARGSTTTMYAKPGIGLEAVSRVFWSGPIPVHLEGGNRCSAGGREK